MSKTRFLPAREGTGKREDDIWIEGGREVEGVLIQIVLGEGGCLLMLKYMILHTDGGCSGNGNPDMSKRKMIAVVSDEAGNILIEKHQEGGSNNIAELLAVKEALMWCFNNKIKKVEIITDSMNNMSWVLKDKVGKKLNDRATVLNLKTAIKALLQGIELKLTWKPREENQAGEYIESKYSL